MNIPDYILTKPIQVLMESITLSDLDNDITQTEIFLYEEVLDPLIQEDRPNHAEWVGLEKCIDDNGHDLRNAVMKEDGIDYPIQVCNRCGWWG